MTAVFDGMTRWGAVSLVVVLYWCTNHSLVWAQAEEIKKALAIKPNQADVDYDQVADDDVKNCRIERAKDVIGIPGWIVRDAAGRQLRKFLDLNQDGQLDQWSFFKNGIEVYRDIDSNYDRKTDQYRWLGTAGTRWGKDDDQDGRIDAWQMISAEEVAAEVFYAIRQNDRNRFLRLLITPTELESLKLPSRLNDSVIAGLKKASAEFEGFVKAQKAIKSNSEFVHFGSSRPNLIAGEPKQPELIIYDHASAVFQTGSEFSQLSLGTLVQVGTTFRALELPGVVEPGKAVANGGVFYPVGEMGDATAQSRPDSANEKVMELYARTEELNKKLQGAKPSAQTESLQAQRADLLWQIIEASSNDEDRANWIRNATDAITSAYQEGLYPSGLEALGSIKTKLTSLKETSELDYLAWRELMARFSHAVEGTPKERAAATEQYLKDLESFAESFPKSEFAAESMMNLALYAEVSDGADTKTALKWYEQVERLFPEQADGKRAAGARVRLTAEGKALNFVGTQINDRKFSLNSLQGKVVVIHYWATWCDACTAEFEEFQRLAAKYQGDLVFVGACLDDEPQTVKDYLAQNRSINWIQLYEPGGIESSPLAQQLGIPTLPWILLVDKEGKVVNANCSALELDREIQRLNKD